MPEREIYLLSPRALSPETIAVAFAKTSRAPECRSVILQMFGIEDMVPPAEGQTKKRSKKTRTQKKNIRGRE